MIRLFIPVFVIVLSYSLKDPFIHSQTENEEFIDVREIFSRHNARNKRSAEETEPEFLRFHLTFLNGSTERLNLRKSRAVPIKVPVYVLKDDQIVRQIMQPNLKETTGFYQDATHNAAIGVQSLHTITGLVHALSGTIQLKNAYHVIRPRSVDGNITHTLSTFDNDISLGTDFIIDDVRTPIHREPRDEPKSTSNPVYNVELLAVTDYAVYNFWDSRSSIEDAAGRDEEVKNNILEYYSYLVNAMDLVYDSITGADWEINVVFAGIVITDSISTFNVTEDIKLNGTNEFDHFVHGETTLRNFGPWLEEFQPELPTYDHAMLFTGYNMYADDTSNPSLLGIAWISRLCSRDAFNITLDYSVVEDNFHGRMALVAAHELGHNLGAKHDGTSNLCLSSDKYNMAPSISASVGSVGKNVYTFSSCSVAYFNKYINYINANNANCMKSLGPEYDQTWFDDYTGTLYGQIHKVDDQCKQLSPLGNDSFICQALHLSDLPGLCTYLYCYVGNNYCKGYFAFEGTQCGQGKLCIGGNCVEDARAANVSETCFFGDNPLYTFDGTNCNALVPNNSRMCYDENVLSGCCQSCASVNTGLIGCEYGDRATGCSAASCGTNFTDCCKTCYNYDTTEQSTASSTTTSTTSTLSTSISNTSSATFTTTDSLSNNLGSGAKSWRSKTLSLLTIGIISLFKIIV